MTRLEMMLQKSKICKRMTFIHQEASAGRVSIFPNPFATRRPRRLMSLVRALLGSFVGAALANNPGAIFFLAGTVTGVYVEQAYKLPDLEDQVKMYIDKLKHLEQDLKKDK